MESIIILGVIVAALLALLWMWNSLRPKPELFCPACGSIGEPETVNGGSGWIELILWTLSIALGLFFLWPFIFMGLIYSLWSFSARRKTCKACGATGLVPPDSPMAQKLMRDMNIR